MTTASYRWLLTTGQPHPPGIQCLEDIDAAITAMNITISHRDPNPGGLNTGPDADVDSGAHPLVVLVATYLPTDPATRTALAHTLGRGTTAASAH